jgi:methionine biosynthesis protein MetW
MERKTGRLDHRIIADIVDEGARVLDLGCGEGDLIALLSVTRKARVQGIELDNDAVGRCVMRGFSVFHGDIESGLSEYPDGSFDWVILNQSMQEVRKVDFVIDECLRVGRRVIVGFPNFAHIRARTMIFFCGRTPITASLPHYWFDTPNVRFLSIKDFRAFCREKGIEVKAVRYVGRRKAVRLLPNLRALNAIFILGERDSGRQGRDHRTA